MDPGYTGGYGCDAAHAAHGSYHSSCVQLEKTVRGSYPKGSGQRSTASVEDVVSSSSYGGGHSYSSASQHSSSYSYSSSHTSGSCPSKAQHANSSTASYGGHSTHGYGVAYS